MSGLYIHVPFCASRCAYCGFYSTTKLHLRDPYVDALCREMDFRKHYLDDNSDGCGAASHIINIIKTVYLGGGTPSQLSPRHLEKILRHVDNTFDCEWQEVTIEANPDDLTREYAATLKSLGVNRVSMGAQTFDDNRLRLLRRRHTSGQVCSAVDILRSVGIGNISIDLMFGFPEESVESWVDDVERALSLGVNHVSAYSLMYEEGTPLGRMLEAGKIKEVDEEVSVEMYGKLLELMEKAGFQHYEISNFARSGFHSAHNSSYWQDVPYIGIGAAAHSYDLQSRQWNVSDIERYIASVENGIVPATIELIDEDTHYDDLVTTTLRTCEGLNVARLKPKYQEHIVAAAKKYIADGMMEWRNGSLRLSKKGLYVSDMIMSDLMIV